MVETRPDCPDCRVEMEQMTLNADGYNLRFVSDEHKEGILGSLGAKETFDANAVVCPDCGLSRLYATLDE